jgi:hypothetical protein
LLRYSWSGDGSGAKTYVTYQVEPHGEGTHFVCEHTGFAGIGGFVMANLILGPVRKRMLDVGLPPVLDQLDAMGSSCGSETHCDRGPRGCL